MFFNNLHKYTNQKIDIYTVIDLILFKKIPIIIISILSIIIGCLLYLAQDKVINASVDIYLKSDIVMEKIAFKKKILKQLELNSFLNSAKGSTVNIKSEKLLLSNLLTKEFLFLKNMQKVIDLNQSSLNLFENDISFLKQINSLNLEFIPTRLGGEDFIVRARFFFVVSAFDLERQKNLMNNFVIKYINYNILNALELYQQDISNSSKLMSEILIRRNQSINNNVTEYNAMLEKPGIDSKTEVVLIEKVIKLNDELLQNNQLLNYMKSNVDYSDQLFSLDKKSYSTNKAFFGLLVIQIFLIFLFNIIYLICLLLKIGFNQNQEIYK